MLPTFRVFWSYLMEHKVLCKKQGRVWLHAGNPGQYTSSIRSKCVCTKIFLMFLQWSANGQKGCGLFFVLFLQHWRGWMGIRRRTWQPSEEGNARAHQLDGPAASTRVIAEARVLHRAGAKASLLSFTLSGSRLDVLALFLRGSFLSLPGNKLTHSLIPPFLSVHLSISVPASPILSASRSSFAPDSTSAFRTDAPTPSPWCPQMVTSCGPAQRLVERLPNREQLVRDDISPGVCTLIFRVVLLMLPIQHLAGNRHKGRKREQPVLLQTLTKGWHMSDEQTELQWIQR